MITIRLTVHQVEMPGMEALHEVNEGDFRRLRAPGKHGFTKKGGAEGNTVEATNQLAIGPCLGRVGKAGLMQSESTALARWR
jgi:hypothetical protein